MVPRYFKSLLTPSMSSVTQSQSQEIPGWKLEINHDGVILNWYSTPTPTPKSSPEIPSLSESNPKSKTNLFDYLYVVSDGVIFSGNNTK